MTSKDFGNAMRKRRVALGLTQEHVAKALDVAESTVSRMERGIVDIDVVRFGRWCEVLALRMSITAVQQ